MKKLITIAIAAVSCFSAFAACSYTPTKETGWVYKWKFTGKTTNGKAMNAAKATSSCGFAPSTCVVRVPASLKIQGYTWACSPGCGSESFETFAEVNEVFWATKPQKDSFAGGVINEIVHIIGKKANEVEVGGQAKFDGAAGVYDFTFAGLGKYDKKNSRITSASGSFAGYVDPCDCASTAVWECGSLNLLCGENPRSVVYGKWSVKYQKTASKKYVRRGVLPKLPVWARNRNAE